jgi:hypothetical protein
MDKFDEREELCPDTGETAQKKSPREETKAEKHRIAIPR